MVPGDPTTRYAGVLLEAITREKDQGIELADCVAVLDSAWCLIPADLACDDAAIGSRLRAELPAIVSAEEPSKAQLEAWNQKSLPPATGCGKVRAAKVATVAYDDEDDD